MAYEAEKTVSSCFDIRQPTAIVMNYYKALLQHEEILSDRLYSDGKGSRLRPLTDTYPKLLLPMASKKTVDFSIETLIPVCDMILFFPYPFIVLNESNILNVEDFQYTIMKWRE
jgi:hypothetical protein